MNGRISSLIFGMLVVAACTSSEESSAPATSTASTVSVRDHARRVDGGDRGNAKFSAYDNFEGSAEFCLRERAGDHRGLAVREGRSVARR